MSYQETPFLNLLETIRELRSDNGCPWDKKQTTLSMIKYLRSEVDELVEAIESSDTDNLCEELGDVLFTLLMIAQINSEAGRFSIDDVCGGITDKLIRRHPHVFSGVQINSEQELRDQWQKIKAEEKSKE